MATDDAVYEPRFDLTPDDIAALVDQVIARIIQTNDEVASVPLDQVTFANTVLKVLDTESWAVGRALNLVVLLNGSPRAEIRGACGMAMQRFGAVDAQQGMRVDLYQVFKQLADRADDALAGCSAEQRRYVTKTVLELERNGLQLDADARTRLSELSAQISTLVTQFEQNLSEESIELAFSPEQLDGVSHEYLAGLPKQQDDGTYTVVLSYPTVTPIMATCTVPETRRRVEAAFSSRCLASNTPILEELTALRHEKATMLGYPSHAAFMLEMQMAQSPETVRSFLREIGEQLTPLATRELAAMLALKQQECARRGWAFDGKLHMWESSYYADLLTKASHAVDSEQLRAYFPLAHVTTELLAMYQSLLGLTFTEIEQPHVWWSGVRQFAVQDARPGQREDGRALGHFYLDLFPRPGKYAHTACMGLQQSSVDSLGRQYLGAVVLFANFRAPTELQPSLLSHGEVVTLFHEFGHVMHLLCTETTTAKCAGITAEKDFIEAPSQMLENWCWEPAPLQRLAKHYATGEPLPDDTIRRLIATRHVTKAYDCKRQIVLATFDQVIHSAPTTDTAELLASLYKQLAGVEPTPGTNFAAAFAHLVNGYDAQYYAYLWSEVYAMDMFQSRFLADGLDNPATGRAYRELILAPGSTADASDMLRAFLGREPSQAPFLLSIGLGHRA